jgi:hypothetical protein
MMRDIRIVVKGYKIYYGRKRMQDLLWKREKKNAKFILDGSYLFGPGLSA